MAHKHVIIIYKIDSTKVMVAQMDKMAPMVVQKTVHFDTKKTASNSSTCRAMLVRKWKSVKIS